MSLARVAFLFALVLILQLALSVGFAAESAAQSATKTAKPAKKLDLGVNKTTPAKAKNGPESSLDSSVMDQTKSVEYSSDCVDNQSHMLYKRGSDGYENCMKQQQQAPLNRDAAEQQKFYDQRNGSR